ncbi:thymidine kinase [Floccifex sp.]|uniref:thymidine kinase n=1 Tax=Floccifex sp. TaxID=2815810 RepID=UPI002A756DF2|nr:thymidine kinase [Floccifex sp.]MDD7281767.1 thymidine kinase [Erysipelotrichaceae bacterium]MDY2958991.1 thymidine kinase [Floccifex sp.]
MAKLIFNYGAMGSSKSANALMVLYNYEERNQNPILLKPNIDTRDGQHMVKSRIGLTHQCDLLNEFLDKYHENNEYVDQFDAIIVDEVQFASREQIDDLSDIVDFHNIPVICYGLRCDFQNVSFPGSMRLMEICDEIKEIKTICWCGKKAVCNARYNENGIVKEGDQVVLGSNESYISLCRKHFKLGQLKKD